MKLKDFFFILLITAFISIVGNFVGYKVNMIEAIPGALILVAISMAGIILNKIIKVKIPSVVYIVALSTILTIPGVPGSAMTSAYVAKVNFLALATPILGYAGVYTGKNTDSLKKTGWKIIVVGFFVMIGTYLSSAIIAHGVLNMIGQI
jgi:hypothetical protein